MGYPYSLQQTMSYVAENLAVLALTFAAIYAAVFAAGPWARRPHPGTEGVVAAPLLGLFILADGWYTISHMRHPHSFAICFGFSSALIYCVVFHRGKKLSET